MRSTAAAAVLLAAVLHAADRQWQTGTWIDAGTKWTVLVGNPAGNPPFGPTGATGDRVQVGTYVIETNEMRIELQDILPIGTSGAFDVRLTIGDKVTFALDGKRTAYVRIGDGVEYRLLVTKKAAKKKS